MCMAAFEECGECDEPEEGEMPCDACLGATACACAGCADGMDEACGLLAEHNVTEAMCNDLRDAGEDYCEGALRKCEQSEGNDERACKEGAACLCAGCAMDDERACDALVGLGVECPTPEDFEGSKILSKEVHPDCT